MSKYFEAIQGLHKDLYEDWSSGTKIDMHRINILLEYSIKHSNNITNLEDRQEIRSLLRFWANYRAGQGEKYPDIDIDEPSRRPSHVTAREIRLKPPSTLSDLRGFQKKVHKLAGSPISKTKFDILLNEFIEIIPGATTEVVSHQRRSQSDVLEDMAWAVQYNVMQLREFMIAQAEVGSNYVKKIWVNAWEILDLRGNFFKNVTQQNLLSGVQYCYFVRNVSQFENLLKMVRKNKKLGKEHEELLTCISISGDMVDLFYLFDFAIWNPHESKSEGYYIHWDKDDPKFYPMIGNRSDTAKNRLKYIYEGVHHNRRANKIDLGPLSATLEVKGATN